MLIQERIARTGSAFKNESERNKYFERRRAENPIFDIDTPIRKASFIVNAGAFGLGKPREGANKRGNSSRLTQSFHFFMFEPIFSPVNALNQPI